MRTRCGWWGAALALAGCATGNPFGSAPPAPADLAGRQIIVLYRPGVVPGPLSLDGRMLPEVDAFDLSGRVRICEVPAPLPVAEAASRIGRLPEVAAAVPNRENAVSAIPNDPLVYRQWAYSERSGLNAFQLWDRADDTSRVVVAVIDTGIDSSHPELLGRVLMGYNTLAWGASRDATDRDGHGTHVAGIIGAAGNNALGVAGVGWGVKLLPLKALEGDGGNDASAIKAIRLAADHNARVINMSFNSSATSISRLYAEAVAYARSKGAVVVGAAGNDGSAVTQPANTPGVIAVGALDSGGQAVAPYSNRGTAVRLVAPGDDILSTVPGARYAQDTGTSMAAPFVSAAAAIVWSRHPDWSVEQVESAVLDAAAPFDGLGPGVGRLDLSRLP